MVFGHFSFWLVEGVEWEYVHVFSESLLNMLGMIRVISFVFISISQHMRLCVCFGLFSEKVKVNKLEGVCFDVFM